MAFTEIGSAWKTRTKNGTTYIRIKLRTGHIVYLFRNLHKMNSSQPDYIVSQSDRDRL